LVTVTVTAEGMVTGAVVVMEMERVTVAVTVTGWATVRVTLLGLRLCCYCQQHCC
jgi:hypothetical protein